MFAILHALGKQLMVVDWIYLVCTIEAGLYTSARLRKIFGGKVYKGGLEFHITMLLMTM